MREVSRSRRLRMSNLLRGGRLRRRRRGRRKRRRRRQGEASGDRVVGGGRVGMGRQRRRGQRLLRLGVRCWQRHSNFSPSCSILMHCSILMRIDISSSKTASAVRYCIRETRMGQVPLHQGPASQTQFKGTIYSNALQRIMSYHSCVSSYCIQ